MEEAQIKVFDVIESEQVNCQGLLCSLFPPPLKIMLEIVFGISLKYTER